MKTKKEITTNPKDLTFKTINPLIAIEIYGNNGKPLGRFIEKDGLLIFEGKVNESGKVFVDFICETFEARIKEMLKLKI